MFDEQGRVTLRGYTLCFLDKLQDSLRRRDFYVSGSDRWGDSRTKLLDGAEWKSHCGQVCRSFCAVEVQGPDIPNYAHAFKAMQSS